MSVSMLVKTRHGFRQQRFRNIQNALEIAHKRQVDLYEEDDDEPNLVYSQSWDVHTKRAVWRTLLGAHGLSPYNRQLLPRELKEGTIGPDFEVA